MKSICAWCQKNIETKKIDNGYRQISHGICDDCALKLEYNYIPLEDFIDEINKPIIIIDKQLIGQGANQTAVKMLQKSKEAIKNQLGGDIMQCIYAALPGGCGETIHCSGCTIRNTVKHTLETGQDQHNVEAYNYLNTPMGTKRMRILISTEKIGESVLLQINNMIEATETES